QWVENPYWQVFTGETYLQTEPPIDPSSLTRWRKRLGEAALRSCWPGRSKQPNVPA
ncbi:MAG: Mobile element protein, partial [uncultured Paraburkholderia sp.]